MPKHESMPVRFKVGDPEGEGQAYLSTLESGPRENSVLNDKAGQYQHYLDLSFSTREFIPSTRKNLPRSVLSNPPFKERRVGHPPTNNPIVPRFQKTGDTENCVRT